MAAWTSRKNYLGKHNYSSKDLVGNENYILAKSVHSYTSKKVSKNCNENWHYRSLPNFQLLHIFVPITFLIPYAEIILKPL
jgi:hypothetical protein